jgi:hypothetical protein
MLRWYYLTLKTLKKPAYVKAFPVSNVTRMPENAEAGRFRYPEKLLFGQSVYFSYGIGIPELRPVEKTGNIIPFRHG